ncbi:MAG: Maf family protein [Puniceicoccales bacterium]|jgi:septum formation protein|nr:Maf family protein [Puniceicoccales bacterium]
MTEEPHFILASASPRRLELLNRHGFFPEVVPAEVVEYEDPAGNPREMVLHNAAIKARFCADRFPNALVLGADTTVALGSVVFNKPADREEARAMLLGLSGKEHVVHTGVALEWRAKRFVEIRCFTSRVRFKAFGEAVVSEYIRIVNPMDKAGAYGIQEGRELIIEDYEEPLSNIMGLPVEWVSARLTALGIGAGQPRT